jgi:hypothetical protein
MKMAPTQKASSARIKPRNGFTVGHTQVAASNTARTITCAQPSQEGMTGSAGTPRTNRRRMIVGTMLPIKIAPQARAVSLVREASTSCVDDRLVFMVHLSFRFD